MRAGEGQSFTEIWTWWSMTQSCHLWLENWCATLQLLVEQILLLFYNAQEPSLCAIYIKSCPNLFCSQVDLISPVQNFSLLPHVIYNVFCRNKHFPVVWVAKWSLLMETSGRLQMQIYIPLRCFQNWEHRYQNGDWDIWYRIRSRSANFLSSKTH